MGKKNKKKKKNTEGLPAPGDQETCTHDSSQHTSALQTASQSTTPCEEPTDSGKSDEPNLEELQASGGPPSTASQSTTPREEPTDSGKSDEPNLEELQASGGPPSTEQESDFSANEDEREDELQGELQTYEHAGNIEVDLKRRALATCNCNFIEFLKPDDVLDVFKEDDVFQPTTTLTVRDIKEQQTTSERNRRIMEAIKRRPSTYNAFKNALVKTGQVQLKRRLEEAEISEHGELQCICNGAQPCHILNNLYCPEDADFDSFSSISRLKPKLFKQFSEAVGDFRDGHYILMAPPTRPIPHLATLGQVPWLAVLDFDQQSRAEGLLAFVERTIEHQRSLVPVTWQDNCSFSEQSTSWIFMLGCNEHPDTLTSNKFRDWRERVSSKFVSIISELEERVIGYTELTVVVIWPDDKDQQRIMKHTLDRLENSRISPTIVVLCNENHKESQLPSEDNHDKLTAIPFSLNDLISSIHSILGSSDTYNGDRKYNLPTSDKSNNPKIDIKDANSLKEDLAVLYIDNETGTDLNTTEIEDERDRFYRGGTLSWSFWYTFKSGGGHIDIERDINRDITTYIKDKHIAKWKSGFVNLYHVPGSGGTTLAQRVMWELRVTAPCVQVLHRADPDLVVEKVKLLCDKTQLPVILLLDGEDEQKVDTIHKHLRDYSCVVFFRVRRCTHKPTLQNGDFYLKRKVSPREANVLCSLYQDQCTRLNKGEECRAQIKAIAEEVQRGVLHSIFDFGLALHDYQYKGIRSYVKSFILTENDDSTDLFPWQNALLMLSIAHYYGQVSIPCHLFRRILKPNSKKVLKFSNLPAEMKELVVPGTTEKQSNFIRISHYVIAKEIIDQLLTQNKDRTFWERPVSPILTKDATQRITPVAVDLIKEAGYSCSNSSTDTIIKVLIRIFISRDNIAVGDEESQLSHLIRPRFSRIMEDVSPHFPYSERFCILEQLTESFPEEAELHAHLGRLYSKCRPEMQVEAERCFKKALQVCDDDKHRNPPKDIIKRSLNLRNIYHMYGNMYLARVTKYTGRFLDDHAVEQLDDSDKIFEVLENVKNACDNFDKSRDVTLRGYETSYGYTDEIRIRLMFCDLAYRNAGFSNIHELLKADKTDLGKFVNKCHVIVEELLNECVFTIDPSKTDEKTINTLQETYHVLFKPEGQALIDLEDKNDIDSWKMKIVLLKMKHGLRTSFGMLDSLENADDIEEIILNYEKILDTYLKNDDEDTARQVDIYFREWLFAIRHKLQAPYSLEKVFKYVLMWNDKTQTQTAMFYLFILKTLYGFGFGSKTNLGNTEMLVQSQNLMTDLIRLSKYIQKPRYPREWLGQNVDSFKCVISGYRFYGKIESRKVQESNQLEILKGTVHTNNKPLGGFISLDLPQSKSTHIKVFFVPAKANMFGASFKGRRVEFILGFTMKHGYEAFNVRELESDDCKHRTCKKRVEFRTCDEKVRCTGCGFESTRNRLSIKK